MAAMETPATQLVNPRRDWAALVLARGGRIEAAGGAVLRYGLVAILLYYGTLKFTATEAKAIEPMIVHSPFFRWMHALLGARGTSGVVGATELVAAALIIARRWLPGLSAIGSLLAVGMFLTTLSFLFTTPGAWTRPADYPLPVPGALGGFLLKDVFLLGASLWSAGEALRAAGNAARRS